MKLHICSLWLAHHWNCCSNRDGSRHHSRRPWNLFYVLCLSFLLFFKALYFIGSLGTYFILQLSWIGPSTFFQFIINSESMNPNTFRWAIGPLGGLYLQENAVQKTETYICLWRALNMQLLCSGVPRRYAPWVIYPFHLAFFQTAWTWGLII
jgi:hypothetical protein